jgi:hypothetical protein
VRNGGVGSAQQSDQKSLFGLTAYRIVSDGWFACGEGWLCGVAGVLQEGWRLMVEMLRMCVVLFR